MSEENKNNSVNSKVLESLANDNAKLKQEIADLRLKASQVDTLTANNKKLESEFTSYKKKTDTSSYFSKLGGKEEYLNDFMKIWDGKKLDDPTELAKFTTKYSIFFKQDGTKVVPSGTPNNAVAGEANANSNPVVQGKDAKLNTSPISQEELS